MPMEVFTEVDFKPATLAIIRQANSIIEEMAAHGYTLTVRQLYYQFVSRDLLANKQANYKRLASIVDNARKAGLIDWEAIEDRTRTMKGYGHGIPLYPSPGEFILREAEHYYYEDLWSSQKVYCEVWVEKDALLGVIERPCNAYRVPYFACRGYASSSALYEAGKRFRAKNEEGKLCVLFHLGDHDPSGLDMTRENKDAVNLFAGPNAEELDALADEAESDEPEDMDFSGFPGVAVKRLALNMDQVRRYNPPPNPAKEADARFAGYVREHGSKSWELDALDPAVIDRIIRDAILGVIEPEPWEAALAAEKANRETLLSVARGWDEVVELWVGNGEAS